MSQQFPNYYQPTGGAPGGPPMGNASSAKAPGIGLCVVGALNLLIILFGLGNNVYMMATGAAPPPPPPNVANNPQAMEFYNSMQQFGPAINIAVGLLFLAANLVVVWGGVNMINARGYAISVAGSIIAMIPCLSYMACCGIGEGIGIWALVVLMNAQVKAGFK